MVEVLDIKSAAVVRNGRKILDAVDLTVGSEERWVILGPNGAGKTTLLSLASASMHPTRGSVTILGNQLGKTDVFEIRPRVGLVSSLVANTIPNQESVLNVALTAAYSVTGRWNEEYDNIDLRRAKRVLQEWQLADFSTRRFGTLSDGEKKRALIARAIMTDPELLLLDEPAANLDLGARENLLKLLDAFALSQSAPAMIMVTHHVEEIPSAFTHALLLKAGQVFAAGKLAETVTSSNISALYDTDLQVSYTDGRFTARSAS